MSVAALKDLIDRLETSVKQDEGKKADEKAVKVFRRTDTNRYANAFRLKKKDFKDQVLIQLGLDKNVRSIGFGDKLAILKLCDEYYNKMAFLLITRGKANKDIEVIVGNDEVTIVAYSRRDLSNFDAITQQTLGSKAILRKQVLQPFIEDLNALLKKLNIGQIDSAFSSSFQLGHQEGSNVQYFIADALQKSLDNVLGTDNSLRDKVLQDIDAALQTTSQKSVNTERSVIIEASSKFHNQNLGDLGKIITLSIESKNLNLTKNEDRGVREELTASLRRFVNNRPVSEWIEQEASDSILRATSKTLFQAAMKAGAKSTNSELAKAIDMKASKANKVNKYKSSTKVVESKLNLRIKAASNSSRRKNLATPSYISLIGLLNSKLPPKVRANMGSPRLNNVSGRLSESARVTNIITTPQGFPSIEYTYQRSPYDVFDKTLGKRPWKTAARDPNELVSMSVRQLATELGMRRFYTRRAQ